MFPVIPGHTALLFSFLIRFSLSDPSPSVFLIIQVHSRDLHKFIQTYELSGKMPGLFYFPFIFAHASSSNLRSLK